MAQTAQLITTPFGRETTAAEVVEGIDLKGKRAVVTGGGSGIGVETARALAGAGAAVTLAVRRPADGEKVAEDIRSSTGNDEVRVAPLELTDYASIAALSASWEGPLDILVNNAGVMAIRELTLTDRGHGRYFEDCNEAEVIHRREPKRSPASPCTRSTLSTPSASGRPR